jgi:hypothetical protein
MALARLGFFQPGFQLVFQEGLLRSWFGFGRHLTNFQSFHPQVFREKRADLGGAAPNARPFGDALNGCVDTLGRPFFKLSFELCAVFMQGTDGLMKIQLFQGFYATGLIQLQLGTQRLLIDLHDPADFLMLQTECFQIDGFHPLSHPSMRMMAAFEMQWFSFFCRELHFDHCGLPPAYSV